MKEESGGIWEWVIPVAVIVACGWAIWHTPAYILDFIPPENQSLYGQISALHERKDVTPNIPGLFGGYADFIDYLALISIPILFVIGTRTIRVYSMEYQTWAAVDRLAIFVGRVTMMMIISLTLVMLYEVFLRYILERPTLWANELTLWLAGFVFLTAGFYGMQQRSHIRIFLLYDAVPRWCQKLFDTVWTLIFVVFAIAMVFGSYKQVFVTKFYRWEMWGTAFDPPIPATIQPAILIIISLVALQAVLNLINDWNKIPEVHSAADDIDENELEAIKRSVGAK